MYRFQSSLIVVNLTVLVMQTHALDNPGNYGGQPIVCLVFLGCLDVCTHEGDVGYLPICVSVSIFMCVCVCVRVRACA